MKANGKFIAVNVFNVVIMSILTYTNMGSVFRGLGNDLPVPWFALVMFVFTLGLLLASLLMVLYALQSGETGKMDKDE